MNSHVQKINKNLMMGWLVIVAVLFVAYCGEVLKGERTIRYLIAFMLATALPAFGCLYMYRKEPDKATLRYYIVVGYFVMYLFSILTGSTSMVFSYILPLLSLLVLYHQPKLIVITGIASLIVNGISIAVKIYNGQMTLTASKDAEIQIALLVLCFGGSFLATRLYDEITEQNKAYLKMLDEKNKQIQKMTLQTIATIANTIDAKDEYTKGHSRRVAEYSAAIARELGFSESEIQDIHSIALLHDIGKIGVPDSVLNKPGRLTQEEYHLMKQHTVIGGEILKDIGTIPGIDIGAKYHHEKYDGTGYPEGITGEDIPFVARIIAVADAYDAMTSSRVYRKRLGEEKVIKEIADGIGTQFDPRAAEALLSLHKEGRLKNISPDVEEEEELNDVARILSRVIGKSGEQTAEKMLLDELTGVYNESFGEKLIKEALDHGNGCLMMFNIDHFRWINDTAGFAKGDVCLKVTSQCIKMLSTEVIVTRLDEDEFAAFFPGVVEKAEAVDLAEQFLQLIQDKITEMPELGDLSVSVGVSICDKDKEDFSEMFEKVEKALYFAKQKGGATYHFHEKEITTAERNLSRVDLEQLINYIKNKAHYEGCFQLTYPEFGKIYEFIKKVADRNNQQVQLLMFTVAANPGEKVSLEEREQVMSFLEHAIIASVRGVDVTTRYSSTQRIVMLMNLDQEQIEIVTDRIMKEFYKMYDQRRISVYYDVADLSE